MGELTHVGSLSGVLALDNIPEHVHGGVGLDRDTSLHTLLVDVLDQLLGARASSGFLIGGIGRGNGGDSSLVVEAVQIATGLLELTDPFVWLQSEDC